MVIKLGQFNGLARDVMRTRRKRESPSAAIFHIKWMHQHKKIRRRRHFRIPWA